MKVAIFHNFMDNIGGAEVVGLTLARALKAPIYTTNINPELIAARGFADVDIRSIGWVPTNAPFRQQLAFARFRMFKLPEQYDCVIIDGDWAMSGGVRNKPAIWYVHSPIREIWDLYEYLRENHTSGPKRLAYDVWVQVNRFFNRRYAEHIDRFVCNSKNTSGRLKKFLGKESVVVSPPIDTKLFSYKPSKGYWLSVNRLYYHKRVELQMEAFARMPDERLIVVGPYEQAEHFLEYAQRVKNMCPDNVEIISRLDIAGLSKLYAECTGFVCTAMDEDFGMTPVEAMAAGKPVIATNEGGYRETVLDGVTGTLLKEPTAEALVAAVRDIGPRAHTYRAACEARAKEFDEPVFVEAMQHIIHDTIKNNTRKK